MDILLEHLVEKHKGIVDSSHIPICICDMGSFIRITKWRRKITHGMFTLNEKVNSINHKTNVTLINLLRLSWCICRTDKEMYVLYILIL